MAVAFPVAVAIGVVRAVADAMGVVVAVLLAVGEDEGVPVGVGEGLWVGVGDGVLVGVGEGVFVGVGEGVLVGVGDGVLVEVGDGVFVTIIVPVAGLGKGACLLSDEEVAEYVVIALACCVISTIPAAEISSNSKESAARTILVRERWGTPCIV